jgi:hypothetical protein
MNRLPVIATVAAGFLIAGLPPAVAAAAPDTASCAQWGFNGATTLQGSDTITFAANGPSLGGPNTGGPYQPPTFAMDVRVDGQFASDIPGDVIGGITGDQIDVVFTAPQMGISVPMDGRISPDGSAHGTVAGTDIKWHSEFPLKCMSTTTSGTAPA